MQPRTGGLLLLLAQDFLTESVHADVRYMWNELAFLKEVGLQLSVKIRMTSEPSQKDILKHILAWSLHTFRSLTPFILRDRSLSSPQPLFFHECKHVRLYADPIREQLVYFSHRR